MLYIYGGIMDKGGRDVVFDDMYVIDFGKLDGCKEIFNRFLLDWIVSFECYKLWNVLIEIVNYRNLRMKMMMMRMMMRKIILIWKRKKMKVKMKKWRVVLKRIIVSFLFFLNVGGKFLFFWLLMWNLFFWSEKMGRWRLLLLRSKKKWWMMVCFI